VPHRSARGPVSAAPRPAVLRLGVLVVASILVAGCGLASGSPPAPTPADFPGITAQLATRGLSVNHFVSGEAGCPDPVLTPTAIAFDAKGLDQATDVRIYLYIFRNRDVFERLRSTIDACAASFATDPDTFESIEASPYVLAGQGPWGQAFKTALREGLAAAAGSGD
jgi:hypothetical protein